MRHLFIRTAFAAGLLLPTALVAHDDAAHAQSAMPKVKGTIEKVDTSAGKLAINHADIPNLKLEGGMTMMFKVSDPAMLSSVKSGDKVSFTADRINGELTVTSIQKAK